MKQLTCKMCGSAEIIIQDGIYLCQTCGSKYSAEEAKKLVVGGTVTIDHSNELPPLLTLIFDYIKEQNFDKANEYCEKALCIAENNAELYYAKLLIKNKVTDLYGIGQSVKYDPLYDKIMMCGNEEICCKLKVFETFVSENTGVKFGFFNDEWHIIGFANQLPERVVIPSQINKYPVTTIDKTAFRYCNRIKSIILPDGLRKISCCAFGNCINLLRIDIPESVEVIEGYAFEYCKSLKEIKLPSNLTFIDKNTFDNCTGLEKVGFPKSLNFIADKAFSECISLKEIVVPCDVQNGAFANCTNLKKITILEGATELDHWAFARCSNLQTVQLPNSLKRIDMSAFKDCLEIQSIVFPESICSDKWLHLDGLKISDIKIPFGIEGVYLTGCSNLESISIPEGVKTVWFDYCSNLTSVSLPQSVEYFSFKYCSNLIDVNIPKGVSVIKKEAFLNCGKLKSIIIPESIIEIGDNAFKNCTCLTSVFIPKSVKKFGMHIFGGCSCLESIVFETPPTPPKLEPYNDYYFVFLGPTYNEKVKIYGQNGIILKRIKKKSSGCYVATCVYGSYDCPQVWTLRRYRDDTLGSTWYGRLFIRTYYAISPTLVKWFGNTNWFKKLWKGKLDRMVAKLQSNGVEDTPYDDKEWQ